MSDASFGECIVIGVRGDVVHLFRDSESTRRPVFLSSRVENGSWNPFWCPVGGLVQVLVIVNQLESYVIFCTW
jgi:hypothetical protein